MFPLDIIQSHAVDKIENILCNIDPDVKFQNVSGNQWQIVVSFDLDKAGLNDVEKMLMGQLLKFL